jgi:hypothetical protein
MKILSATKLAIVLAVLFTALSLVASPSPNAIKSAPYGDECAIAWQLKPPQPCSATIVDGGGGGFGGRLCNGMCMLSINL